jgi:ubiquinone/menaquinone biosynthesis C-methylase UbiE
MRAVNDERRWNHNLHYGRGLLSALPSGAQRALDVGCGEGTLTRELRARVPQVTAIDRDATCIELARRQTGPEAVEYLVGDFLTWPFQPSSFDVVVSVAALHHMDERAALERMRWILRPGGTLVVLGLARRRWPVDLPRDLGAVAASWILRRQRGCWQSAAPTTSPARTYGEVRKLAEDVLGPVAFRRHLLWRYSLVWSRPHDRDQMRSNATGSSGSNQQAAIRPSTIR